MLALSEPVAVTVVVAGLVAFLALVALARALLSRAPAWRRVRVGVFVERDPELGELELDDDEAPTMVYPPRD
jgi:hypothetical protein